MRLHRGCFFPKFLQTLGGPCAIGQKPGVVAARPWGVSGIELRCTQKRREVEVFDVKPQSQNTLTAIILPLLDLEPASVPINEDNRADGFAFAIANDKPPLPQPNSTTTEPSSTTNSEAMRASASFWTPCFSAWSSPVA